MISAGAEEAYLAAHESSWSPQPGLALLRLEQGDAKTAAALIEDAIENPFNVPSKERPPHGGLRKAPLLDAQVEIAVACGDPGTARKAADELRAIAETFQSQALHASAALAQGRASLAEGEPRSAVGECERALTGWVEVGAPFEAGVTRMVLGQARRLAGNEEGALMDWRAARRSFEEFGATRWAERAAVAAHQDESVPTSEPSPAGTSVFRCRGDARTIRFDGSTVMLKDLLGLRYLERLLAEPNREFHALDLVAVERGSLPTVPNPGELDTTSDGGHAGMHLDAQARQAYRRRLTDIEEDMEDARTMNDPERLALASSDRDYLIAELSRAVGLGGRPRAAGATSERARTSVTRSIRYAISRVGEHHPALGDHLRHAVSTGIYCAYRPDPRLPVTWVV